MKKLVFLTLLLITTPALALLPTPPVAKEIPKELQQYMQAQYDNHNVLEVLTTTPNGNRKARKGSVVIYNNQLWYNTDNATAWTAL